MEIVGMLIVLFIGAVAGFLLRREAENKADNNLHKETMNKEAYYLALKSNADAAMKKSEDNVQKVAAVLADIVREQKTTVDLQKVVEENLNSIQSHLNIIKTKELGVVTTNLFYGSFIVIQGKLDFVCNTKGVAYREVKAGLIKLKDEIQRQLENEENWHYDGETIRGTLSQQSGNG